MDRKKIDDLIIELCKTKGLVEVKIFSKAEDGRRVLDIEQDVEERSLLGLGKVINVGVREVLDCDLIYVALTGMEFDWCCPNLVMKKDLEVVGEEVRDEETISRLSKDKNVWFMHKNFVIYKDKVSFPKDVMNKNCHFEIPVHFDKWRVLDNGELQYDSIIYGSPSTPCDVFLKQKYFDGADASGLGTILIGVRL
jgi:hypothetical protein